VTLLEGPQHGELDGEQYLPTSPDYYGEDSATLLVEIGGYTAKVIYVFNITSSAGSGTEGYDPYEDPELCPNGRLWRISLSPDDPNATVYTIPYPDQWSGLLAEASKVTVTFADLPGEALGQRLGNTITLDVDAAGHGWFVDETPWDNSEYVATSNLNAWVAKSDSDAAGKMDLLSVLLHEYGHVLGLTHSEAAHTLMSDSLEAGERHTVSMAEMEAIYDHLDIALPSDPNSPFNPLPWSTSLLFGFTRLRRDPTGDVQGSTSAAGGGTPGAANGIVLPPPPSDPNATSVTPAPIYSLSAQYQEALHTGLYNGDFALFEPTDAFYGWDTRGQVSLSDGLADLTEDPRAYSGLTQTFIKPEGIQGLRFTLVGTDFGNDASAPPDAFEVALLDALTGQSVLGTAGLTHTDALFNLQADGTAYADVSVRVKGQAIGNGNTLDLSEPLRITVDLSGVADGTALKLYFDLLGMGEANSRVRIDDVQLLTNLNTEPVAVDDDIATAEDTAVTLNVLANDLDAEVTRSPPRS